MSLMGINVPNSRPFAAGNIPLIYSGSNIKNTPLFWTSYTTTNSSGQAIFYSTNNGARDGVPYFSNIYTVLLTPRRATDVAATIPLASLKEINFANAEIIANIVSGNAKGSSGIGVYCTIIGE